MTVYVLHHYWDTPDTEGTEVVGVWACKENAQARMVEEAKKIRMEFPTDFWEEDMTWEDDNEIHLGFDPKNLELATIYCWTIHTVEVQ